MTEPNAFEARLGAAVRSYAARVSSDLDAAELAHRIVAAAPRGRRLAWPWTLRPAQALVWLVILGLLIAALAAGIFVGSQRPALAFACPPGSTPDKPGPVEQSRPITYDTMGFDRGAGRLVVISSSVRVETWTFDVCTNTWTQLRPDGEPPTFAWASLVEDVDSNVMIAIEYSTGSVWVLDLEANTWTEKRPVAEGTRLWAYDPRSGLVIGTDSTDISSYDVETDTWTPIHEANGPDSAEFAYDASVDRLVAYAGPVPAPETWLFDLRTATWSRSGAHTPAIVAGMGLPHTITYDEAAQRTVVISNSGLAAYDATADEWELVLGGEPGSVPDMAFDPLNRRFVGPSAGPGISTSRSGVVAFDLVNREWTVLLEAQ